MSLAIRSALVSLALVGLISGVQMDPTQPGPQQAQGPLGALNGLTGGLTSALSGGQNQAGGPLGGLNGLTSGLMGPNSALGGLLGGNQQQPMMMGQQQGMMGPQQGMMGQQGYMNPQGMMGQQGFMNPQGYMGQQGSNGLMDNVRLLLQNVMNGVRNLVSPGNNGFGRNNMMPRNPLQQQQQLQQQPMYGQQQQQPSNSLLPDMNSITGPITDALSQGRLPDVNRLTSNLGQTVNNLGQGLTGALSNPMNQAAQQQQQPQPQQQQQQPIQQAASGAAPSA